MSDREFDNYLMLLGGLLRLDSRQRRAIADELRSHLEDRLDELVAQGVLRDEAVERALSELGDAAGLAGQFLKISSERKRRWLMRMTTFSVAATLLLAAGIVTFWPGRNAAPGMAVAHGQAAAEAQPAPSAEPAQSDETALTDKLNRRMDVTFEAVPLSDALDYIAQAAGLQFVVARKKLEEAGVSVDSPVTLRLKRAKASTILEFLLRDLELTYVDRDEVLVVTTPEDAEATLQIRVYDCRDLLAMPSPSQSIGVGQPSARTLLRSEQWRTAEPQRAQPIESASEPAASPLGEVKPAVTLPLATGESAGRRGGVFGGAAQTDWEKRTEQLSELVTATVDPDSWAKAGGPGAIDSYNGLIVITQTNETHKRVEHVFEMLRQAAGIESHDASKVVR